jgi:DNA-binding transcriptional LysR family regulator
VSATPQVVETFLAPFLAQFFRSHPGVEVQLLESGGEHQRGQLERSDIDLALMASGAERLQGRALYPIHVLAVISAEHRFSRRATVGIEEIADEPLLLLSRDFGSRAWFDAACSLADVQLRILLESSSPATLMALAAIDYGIAIIPSNVHALRGRVRALPLLFDGQSIGKWSMIAWNPRRPLAPYAVHFIEEIAGHARRSYPGRELTRRAPTIPRPKEAAG